MSNNTITSANADLKIIIARIFPQPVAIEGFATDDAFMTDAIDVADTQMGVDGRMSAGFMPAITPLTISLQADSPSVVLFETWDQSQGAQRELLFAQATLEIPGIGRSYLFTKGVLKNLKRLPDAKKVLQARQFVLHFERCVGSALGNILG